MQDAKKGPNTLMRRNSVTPLASPEPTKKPRINSFEEHVAAAASAAHPICMPQEAPAQLPGQVGYFLSLVVFPPPPLPRSGGGGGLGCAVALLICVRAFLPSLSNFPGGFLIAKRLQLLRSSLSLLFAAILLRSLGEAGLNVLCVVV